MTKIERAEEAILKLKDEGKLPQGFGIERMRVAAGTGRLTVWGKAPAKDRSDERYYEWVESGNVLEAKVCRNVVGRYWDDDESCMRSAPVVFEMPVLHEERAEGLDIALSDGPKKARCCFNCRHSVFRLADFNGYSGQCVKSHVGWLGYDCAQGDTVSPDGICDEYEKASHDGD